MRKAENYKIIKNKDLTPVFIFRRSDEIDKAESEESLERTIDSPNAMFERADGWSLHFRAAGKVKASTVSPNESHSIAQLQAYQMFQGDSVSTISPRSVIAPLATDMSIAAVTIW